jgi:hypothetical protein
MRRLLLAVVLVGSAARVGSAQESLDFLNADRETSAQITRIMESVRAANLPTAPVVATARHALQVHAPPTRLIAALQAVASRLEASRSALGPASPEADILAGQDALSTNGVTKEMLYLIRRAQPNRSVAVALGLMAQLVASGVAPKQAVEIVSRLAKGKATPKQLADLGNDVSQDVIAGAGAASALQIRLESLRPLLSYGAAAPGITADAPSGLTNGASGTGPKNPRGRP